MTSNLSYAGKYHDRWAPYDDALNELVLDESDEVRWQLPIDNPTGFVSRWLDVALRCIYAADDLRGGMFLRRADYYADRLIAEKRYLDTPVAVAGHPRHLAEILRFRAYTQWLLGMRLKREDLRQAASDYIEWCLAKAEDKKRFSDPVTMGLYLDGARVAMVAGHLDYASELLATQQPFRWRHAPERQLWIRLTSSLPNVDDELKKDIEGFFNRVRDPDFEGLDSSGNVSARARWLALDSGIIRAMYIMNRSPDEAVDPKTVIAAVAF